MTGRRDLKLAGNGGGVCELLMYLVQQSPVWGLWGLSSRPALPLWGQLPFPTRQGTLAILVCHLGPWTPPAGEPWATNFFVRWLLVVK